MFVLGIDPGLSRCGYCCLSGRGATARAVAAGVVTTPPAEPVPQLLATLQREVRGLLGELAPEVVALERVLFQVNVRTAMGVGQAAGVVMAEAVAAGCAVVEYSPNQIKQAVCGDGAAGKDQVGRMVQMLLGLAEPLRPADVSDAAAVALCHLAQAPTAPPPAAPPPAAPPPAAPPTMVAATR
ncbi:MAG: crossover junction endodeoxyribonuclease RuvC [bacterium]|nr:crossover junction endodeoxyribonuclease RuvC [bacterium]